MQNCFGISVDDFTQIFIKFFYLDNSWLWTTSQISISIHGFVIELFVGHCYVLPFH